MFKIQKYIIVVDFKPSSSAPMLITICKHMAS